MSQRAYDGPALDGTFQSISEAPYWQGEGETVDVVDDTELGEITTEGEPDIGSDKAPDVDGQSTWEDWGWSA